MLTRHYGFGGDLSSRRSQGAYAGVNYRPFFYNFDGIVQPMKSKRVAPELRAGIGGVSVRYCYNRQFCDQPLLFQVHGAAAVRLYVTVPQYPLGVG